MADPIVYRGKQGVVKLFFKHVGHRQPGDPAAVITSALRSISRAIPGARAGALYVPAANGRMLLPWATWGKSELQAEPISPRRLSRAVQAWSAHAGSPPCRVCGVPSRNLPEGMLVAASLPEHAVLIPVRQHGRLQGVGLVLTVRRPTFRGLTAQRELVDICREMLATLKLAATLRDTRAKLAEERRLRKTVARMGERAQAVNDVIATVTSSLDLEQVLAEITRQARRLIDFDRIAVSAIDAAQGHYHVLHVDGLQIPTLLPRGPLRLDGTPVEAVARQRKPVMLPDLADQPPFNLPPELLAHGLRSAMYMPLPAHGRVTGALSILSRHPRAFGDTDVNALMAVAGALGVALENARLYREAQELAVTDALTGLWNRRYFNTVWPREIERAQRSGAPISVLMVDVHNFKHYNDMFGHLAGDERLREVGALLRAHTRAADVAVRYGGDEFVVLMPDTDRDQAECARERLIAALTERNLSDQMPGDYPLWLNIGIESAQGQELPHLLLRADLEMYRHRDTVQRMQMQQLEESAAEERKRHTLGAVLSLAKILEMRDPYTRGHSERLKLYAGRVGRALELSPQEVQDVEYAAVLHDIGKLVLPVEILNKRGPLTPEEKAVMRRHPEHGENIVAPVELLAGVRAIVRHHQERWDGSTEEPYPGYPDRLKGEQIPIGARIIAVVDTFDAMTSDRPYRRRLPVADAIAELERAAGHQFDPRVAEAFLATLRERMKAAADAAAAGGAPDGAPCDGGDPLSDALDLLEW